jgi:GT2 family glycosyltransferase
LHASSAETVQIRALFKMLLRQPYPHWSVAMPHLQDSPQDLPPARVVRIDPAGVTSTAWSDLGPNDFVVPLACGDILADYALGTLAEYVLDHPDVELIYADEDSIDAAGRYREPRLKPEWSPVFQQSQRYVGCAVYFRTSMLSRLASRRVEDLWDPMALWDSVEPGKKVVGHVRRVLLTKAAARSNHAQARSPSFPGTATLNFATPYASVIVPVKDRPHLLAACIGGLRHTAPSGFEVIIVDNGSEQEETFEIYKSLQGDSRFRILQSPGPFNFSELCNRAAVASRSCILAFLNNDVVPMHADWLLSLSTWAKRPEVGAVGPRLFYPSGRLQHAGVVLGLGGYAAHVGRGAKPHEAGYLGRFSVPHEVSAVTGACLVVEKAKFDAVGGFDELAFPVELGDVDFCLRLAKRGWTTLLIPEVKLVHHESATRGPTRHGDERYAGEQRRFEAQWKGFIRDDPYFHPALSLTSLRTMLEQ